MIKYGQEGRSPDCYTLEHCTLLKGQLEKEKGQLEKETALRRELEAQWEKDRKKKDEVETRLQLLVSNFERLADDAMCSGDIVFNANEAQFHAHSCIGMIPDYKRRVDCNAYYSWIVELPLQNDARISHVRRNHENNFDYNRGSFVCTKCILYYTWIYR